MPWVRIAIILGVASAVIGGFYLQAHFFYVAGARACEAAHDATALKATTQTLKTADTQNRVDEQNSLDATIIVSTDRSTTEQRVALIHSAPIHPTAGVTPDANACPDLFTSDFWRLYDDPPAGDPAPGPAPGDPAGVPGRR